MPTKVTFRSPWTSAEECRLMQMKVNGSSVASIADVLNRSESSIRHKWKSMQPPVANEYTTLEKAVDACEHGGIVAILGKRKFRVVHRESFYARHKWGIKIAAFLVLASGFLYLAATTPTV